MQKVTIVIHSETLSLSAWLLLWLMRHFKVSLKISKHRVEHLSPFS